ncbi:ABC transporter permease (plasmid) [Paraburkholderia terrae]|uniref:ABC transporter permease n=1 Tax=Paraburkholderia terrae TaxID=311230 RepID=A0ABN6JXA0_9BURK|nr:ABC transporter permease [Paraburkholderia terrae]BCZ85592.1 ABC transporter permease [Paraburkholderia terrae]
MKAIQSVSSPVDTSGRTILCAVLMLLLVAGCFNSQFFSLRYLLLQLQSAAILGVIAAGAMLVILTGHIDLSVPWTLTVSAVAASAFAQSAGPDFGAAMSPLVGLAAGAAIGVVNGFGVAWLRVPSLIWTLAVNAVLLGLNAYFGGGASIGSHPSALVLQLGGGRLFDLVPNAALIWITVSIAVAFLLRRTIWGRYLHAVGAREKAAWLSGIDTRKVLLVAFIFSGLASAAAGLLLSGYAGQAYQRMGDPYLLPGIAAVVVGGTSILGGKGSYSGTVAGVLLITLMSSLLSLLHVPEALKQICYGALIVGTVLVYSRKATASTRVPR